MFDAFFYKAPFIGGNDAGDDIKGKYFLDPFATAVNGKGYTLTHEQSFGQLFFARQIIRRFTRQVLDHFRIMRTDAFVAIHFVPNATDGMIFFKIS